MLNNEKLQFAQLCKTKIKLAIERDERKIDQKTYELKTSKIDKEVKLLAQSIKDRKNKKKE